MVTFNSVFSDSLIKHTHNINFIHEEKNLSPSQGLNLGLPNTSQMLLPRTQVFEQGINYYSLVILLVHKSILY